jgi:hypothetical protein
MLDNVSFAGNMALYGDTIATAPHSLRIEPLTFELAQVVLHHAPCNMHAQRMAHFPCRPARAASLSSQG